MIPSLEGWPTKAKEPPSPHEVTDHTSIEDMQRFSSTDLQKEHSGYRTYLNLKSNSLRKKILLRILYWSIRFVGKETFLGKVYISFQFRFVVSRSFSK